MFVQFCMNTKRVEIFRGSGAINIGAWNQYFCRIFISRSFAYVHMQEYTVYKSSFAQPKTEAFGTRFIAQPIHTYTLKGGGDFLPRLENTINIEPTWVFHVHGQLLPFPPLTKFSEIFFEAIPSTIPHIFYVSKVFSMLTVYSMNWFIYTSSRGGDSKILQGCKIILYALIYI